MARGLLRAECRARRRHTARVRNSLSFGLKRTLCADGVEGREASRFGRDACFQLRLKINLLLERSQINEQVFDRLVSLLFIFAQRFAQDSLQLKRSLMR